MVSVEMCYAAVANLGSFTDSTELLDLPFLFKTEEAAQEVLSGEIGTGILDSLTPVTGSGGGQHIAGDGRPRLVPASDRSLY